MTKDTYRGETSNPQSLNQYAYVFNNPINYTDPSGNVPDWVKSKSNHTDTGPKVYKGIDSEGYHVVEQKVTTYTYKNCLGSPGSWRETSRQEYSDRIEVSTKRSVNYTYIYSKNIRIKEWHDGVPSGGPGTTTTEKYNISGSQTGSYTITAKELNSGNQDAIKITCGEVVMDWNDENDDVVPLVSEQVHASPEMVTNINYTESDNIATNCVYKNILSTDETSYEGSEDVYQRYLDSKERQLEKETANDMLSNADRAQRKIEELRWGDEGWNGAYSLIPYEGTGKTDSAFSGVANWAKGYGKGLVDTGINTISATSHAIMHPIATMNSFNSAIWNADETIPAIGNSIGTWYNDKIVNGDSYDKGYANGQLSFELAAIVFGEKLAKGLQSANSSVSLFDDSLKALDNGLDEIKKLENATGGTSETVQSTALQTYYPPNDGFLGEVIDDVLQPGTMVDRYGYPGGSYVAPIDTPAQMRALAPGTLDKPYNVYEVVEAINVKSGPAAPWFEQIGLGTQYKFDEKIIDLLEAGILKKVN